MTDSCKMLREIGRTEEICIQLGALAQEDHTYTPTRQERIQFKGLLCFTQNETGKNTPATRQRDRRKVQPLPAVKSSDLTYHHLRVSHSDLNRNRSSCAHPWANVPPSESSHSWWSSSSSLVAREERSPTRDGDLHVRDLVCKKHTASVHAQNATFFSCVHLLAQEYTVLRTFYLRFA